MNTYVYIGYKRKVLQNHPELFCSSRQLITQFLYKRLGAWDVSVHIDSTTFTFFVKGTIFRLEPCLSDVDTLGFHHH